MATSAAAEKDRAWVRLGELIQRRRVDLGFTQRDAAAMADVSATTWNLLELGKQTSYRPLTLAAVERTMRWATGSIAAVLAGSEPTPVESAPSTAQVDFNSKIARLSAEDQRYVDELVERLLRERDA